MLLSKVFHDIEKKIIRALKETKNLTPEKLEETTELSPDQIRRGIEWLKLKNLADVKESKEIFLKLGKNGKISYSKGLPERQLLNLLKEKPRHISELQNELKSVFGPAIGSAKKNMWVKIDDNVFSLKNEPSEFPEEDIINQIGEKKIPISKINDKKTLDSLKKRPDYIIEEVEKSKIISLSKDANYIDLEKSESGAIDVEADVPEVHVARTHPLKDTIDEIREIFVTLGFTEINGTLSQPSFWNFDALFTPQDHPVRELQDTFYLDGISAKK